MRSLIQSNFYSTSSPYVIFGLGGGAMMLLAAAIAERGPAAQAAPRPRPLGELLRLRPFAILYVSIILVSYGVFVPFVFLVRSAERQGIDEVPAALLVGLIGGSSVVGRLALGTLADRLGAVRLFLTSFVVLAASHVIWLVAGDSYGLLVCYSLVFGLGYGGFIALAPAVVAEVFGLEGLGGMIGTVYTAAAVGALSGPPIAGWLVDQQGDRAAIVLALVMSTAASLVLSRLSAHVGHVEASLEPAP